MSEHITDEPKVKHFCNSSSVGVMTHMLKHRCSEVLTRRDRVRMNVCRMFHLKGGKQADIFSYADSEHSGKKKGK